MQEQTQSAIRVIGNCHATVPDIRRQLRNEGPAGLKNLGGDYVIVLTCVDDTTYIVSSPYGVTQYFYTVEKGTLHHGPSVLDVLNASRLPWHWDWKSVGDLIMLDHLLEDETLHPDIRRLPAACVLTFRRGELTLDVSPPERLHTNRPASALEAVEAFNKAVAQSSGSTPVLSMSGGFDSRAILAALVNSGQRPELLTMGFDDSTDMVISRLIARSLDLNLTEVALSTEDYVTHARTIVELTNGTKSAANWHTYVYSNKARTYLDGPLLVGTNGEFARSFLVDRGPIALAALVADLAGRPAVEYFWRRKLKPIFKPDEIAAMHTNLRAQFSPAGQRARISRLVELSGTRLLSGLDRFYLHQRVRHFMGNGVALYRANFDCRTPFLDRDWCSAIWALPRRWKIGANWHRYAIWRNCPQLLDFPEERMGNSMARRAPVSYWLPLRRRPAVVPYARYGDWFRSPLILNAVRERSNGLADLVDPRVVERILLGQEQFGNRVRAVGVLLALGIWSELVAEPRRTGSG